MKHSEDKSISRSNTWAAVLMWCTPLLLIIPNICFIFTESLYSSLDNAINIFLPLGAYMLFCACCKRIGITVLLCFPLSVLCAFQIVLLSLYGEAVIAIDMFVNVVTTNAGEVKELLSNLIPAVLTVCVLYLPPIAASIILLRHKCYTSTSQRKPLLFSGSALLLIGVILLGFGFLQDDGYLPTRKLFPVNAANNLCLAIQRTRASENYDKSSANFRFHASSSTETDSDLVVVLVIGETSRGDHWQLDGYPRETNPNLYRRNGLIFYQKALSESNTTHKSVPLLMSHLDSSNYGDSIYCVKGILEAFGEAGFSTAWISNQQRNHSLIDFFGEQADTSLFLTDDNHHHLDGAVLPPLCNLTDTNRNRLFAAIHTYGSHFNYHDRIPNGFGDFSPCNISEATKGNREQLINEYDNTILYTDQVLDSIIGILEASGRPAVMIYTSDHGEDIFDDDRGRFLHASPTPTCYQLHVPLLIWTSAEYRNIHPEVQVALERYATKRVSSSRSIFHTLIDLAAITTPTYADSASLASENYCEPVALYLNDYNEPVPLSKSGLHDEDFYYLRMRGLVP